MKKVILFFLISFQPLMSKAEVIINQYQSVFDIAYSQFPQIPRGVLEAVSFTQTHFKNIQNPQQSCLGLPVVNGVMGLTENGMGYFRENLQLVSNLSGYSVNAIKSSPSINILAYAKAYKVLMDSLSLTSFDINNHDVILKSLSEIPWDHNPANNFALNSFVYQVFDFLKNPQYQSAYGFQNHNINMVAIFGQQNYEVLSSTGVVTIEPDKISIANGVTYQPQYKSPDYPPALWVAAPSCNYSSRSGTAVSAVTIHTIQGSYAGAISWSQNCSANVSYHYVIRSSDGQVTQMVLESDKAWHVGSENPYTIGFEHEGYVNDASWYTQAMYEGSAAIVRDICTSGYGINPLRTFYGAATSGLNTLGGCTKIKGHQHYPNQSHTDPGINWDWEKYYKLINDNPTITTFNTATGTLYDSGGATGNYSDDERELYLIQPTGGASVISLTFTVFDLELNWDYMYIYDGTTTDDPLIGIYTGTTNPTTISSTGGSILLEFRSDCATTAPGWEVSWTSTGGNGGTADIIAPTTQVSVTSNWKTADFTTTFTDADETGGSGLMYQFYQVIDFDGVEWRANANNGFYSDNFDNSINSEWTQQTAVWTINNSFLESADEVESNTNIYTSLNQSGNDMYLYHWGGMIGGAGTNKRAGLHFMCSDPTLTNRGNSYLVYFREDNDKIQIYECVNNGISLMVDVPYTINANQWYDFKITYNKLTGEIDVYVDNLLEASWTDSTPLTTGNAISFRGGNCIYQTNNLKVYHNRSSSEIVTVGVNSDLRYQNPNPTTFAGRIKSIVIDSAKNLSAISFQDVNIDWTPPQDLSFVNDGTGSDISVFTSNNSISGNWSVSTDVHSDIAAYHYAVGTSPGATDVIGWTNNWFNTSFTETGLNLVYGTTYYVSVRAENGAGLFSNVITSNGQTLQNPTNPPVATFTVPNTYVCITDSLQFVNNSVDAVSYSWSVPGATPSTSTDVNPYFSFPNTGTYTVTLTVTNTAGSDTEVQNVSVVISNPASANITSSTNLIDLALGSNSVTFNNTSINADGYFWDFGNGQTSTDVNPWTTYTQEGTYNVMCVAINGVCQNDTAWTTIEVINTVGLNEVNQSNLILYPNPVNDVLNIKFPTEEFEGTIKVFDTRGRMVFSQTLKGNLLNIDMSYLVDGLYIIEVNDNRTIIYKEIIKN